MSFLSTLRRLYKNLKDGLHWAHLSCKIATKINNEIQASNASDALKAITAAFVTQAQTVCDAIQAYIDSLPGNS